MDYVAVPMRGQTIFETPTAASSLWIENLSSELFYAEHQLIDDGQLWVTKNTLHIPGNDKVIIDDINKVSAPKQRILCVDHKALVDEKDTLLFLISVHPLKQIPTNTPLPTDVEHSRATVIEGHAVGYGDAFDRRNITECWLVVKVINAIPGTTGGIFGVEHSDDGVTWSGLHFNGLVNGGISVGGRYCYSGYRTYDEINPAGMKRFIRPYYMVSPHVGGIAFRFVAEVYIIYRRRVMS